MAEQLIISVFTFNSYASSKERMFLANMLYYSIRLTPTVSGTLRFMIRIIVGNKKLASVVLIDWRFGVIITYVLI